LSEGSVSKSTGDHVTVTPCGAADRSAQAGLFNHCFKKKLDERALAWRYDENPLGRAVSFMSRRTDGEGVSGYACSPRLAIPFGDASARAIVGETGDVMTHPEWRKKGLFSALDRAAMAETARLGWPIVFGLPNRRSAHIFLELGWENVGTLRPWTFLLASGAAARRERSSEGRVRGWLAPIGAWRGRRARRELIRASGAGLTTREIDSFPAEVAALSAAVEPRFSWMVRRDAAYLDWRFAKSPSGLHRRLGIFDARGAFAGYAVVQLPRAGESVGYLVDVLGRDDAVVSAAIAAGLQRLEESGAVVVRATAIDGSWWSTTLARAGFLPPRPENHLIVILYVHDAAHPLARAARDTKNWYLTDGDRDDETMG
jgi:GNAT superfamily N-acetyltransferase